MWGCGGVWGGREGGGVGRSWGGKLRLGFCEEGGGAHCNAGSVEANEVGVGGGGRGHKRERAIRRGLLARVPAGFALFLGKDVTVYDCTVICTGGDWHFANPSESP